MADNHTKEIRSKNMSHIRSKNTKPEAIVRKYLFSRGLRYRKNDKRYPGCPDIVLPRYKTCVFVNGCFWHQHPNCKYAVLPSSNMDYWIPKLQKNKQRDIQNEAALKDEGWRVITVWECELKVENKKQTLEYLYNSIISYQRN